MGRYGIQKKAPLNELVVNVLHPGKIGGLTAWMNTKWANQELEGDESVRNLVRI